jgi:hypothetical protein
MRDVNKVNNALAVRTTGRAGGCGVDRRWKKKVGVELNRTRCPHPALSRWERERSVWDAYDAYTHTRLEGNMSAKPAKAIGVNWHFV